MMSATRRPVILGIGNRKGGAGKSTLATGLAIVTAEAGIRTYLADADVNQTTVRQMSAYEEFEKAPANLDYGRADDPVALASLRSSAAIDGYDLVVVDLPGATQGGELWAVLVGDNGEPVLDGLLIPTLTGPMDVDVLGQTLRDVRLAQVKHLVVLSRVNPHPAGVAAAKRKGQELLEAGAPVMVPVIRSYSVLEEAQQDAIPITSYGGRRSYARKAETDLRAVAHVAFGPQLLKTRWSSKVLASKYDDDRGETQHA